MSFRPTVLSKRPHRRCVLLALLAAVGSSACVEAVEVENLPPVVELLDLCSEDGRAYVRLRVVEFDGESVDLELSTAGSEPGPLALGPSGDGIVGLRGRDDGEGALHLVEWADEGRSLGCPTFAQPNLAEACAPRPQGAVAVRLVVVARDSRGNASAAAAFDLEDAGACQSSEPSATSAP